MDPRGPTDINPDPVPATSSMAVCRKSPPKRLNYDRKKFICEKLKSKTLLLQQKHATEKQPEEFAAKETHNIIVENQDGRLGELNVPLHELLTPQCTLEERPQDPSRQPLLQSQNVHLKKDLNQHVPATINNKDQSKRDDDRSSEGNLRAPLTFRVVPVAVHAQTPDDPSTPSSTYRKSTSVADVIVSCNNLVHAVMKRFDNWLVRFELESDAYTARIVKLLNYRQSVSVDVTVRRDKFHVSVDVFRYRLRESHPFWARNPKPADIGGVLRLLEDVSQWQICLKLRSTPSYDMKPTTCCMLLCQLPRVMCGKCAADAERRMNQAGEDLTEKIVMSTQHRLMSKRALCVKTDILRKKLRAVTVQNQRLKARMARAVPPRENEESVERESRKDVAQRTLMDVDPFSMTKEEVCAQFGVLRRVYKADSLKHQRLRKKLAKVTQGNVTRGAEEEVNEDVGKMFKMRMQHKYLSKDALCEKYGILRNVLKALAARNDDLKRRIAMAVAEQKKNGVPSDTDGNEQRVDGGTGDADDVEVNGSDADGDDVDDGERNGVDGAESGVCDKEEYSEDVEESV